MELLFSYGTLQSAPVQLATFGRLLEGKSDVLVGYALSYLTITDEAVLKASGLDSHPILLKTSVEADRIEGTVFTITGEELLEADRYEVADYERAAVTLESGLIAWVYVGKVLYSQ